jgi:hypothetical protein
MVGLRLAFDMQGIDAMATRTRLLLVAVGAANHELS